MRPYAAALVLGLFGAGCAGILALDDVSYVTVADAGNARDAALDSTRDSPDAPTFEYFDIADPARWTNQSLSSLGLQSDGYWANAVFDGRYVHFGPDFADKPLLSYDTSDPNGFGKVPSWRAVPIPLAATATRRRCRA